MRDTKEGFLETCPGNIVIFGNKARCIGGQDGRLVGERRDNQKQKRELKETVGIKPLPIKAMLPRKELKPQAGERNTRNEQWL